MGVGKAYSMHEIDDTRRSGAEEAFEDILKKVIKAGGQITKDETVPLYAEIGMQEGEVGEERIVEFNLNKFDFQLTRKKETHRITGAGRQKSLEPLNPPRVTNILKRKSQTSQDWQLMDMENMM